MHAKRAFLSFDYLMSSMRPTRRMAQIISDSQQKKKIKYLEEFGIPHMMDIPNLGFAPSLSRGARSALTKNLKQASKIHGREKVYKEVYIMLRQRPYNLQDSLLKRAEELAKK
jgi:hypothetical protein